MSTKSGKTEDAKPSQKPAKTDNKEEQKDKDKPKHKGEGEGPTKF